MDDKGKMDKMDSDPAVDTVYLWKDVWWIKSTLFTISLLIWYFVYKILIKMLEGCMGRRQVREPRQSRQEPELDIDDSGKRKMMDAKIVEAEVVVEDNQETNVLMTPRLGRESKPIGKGDQMKELENSSSGFHDLEHHGIRYYDDNMSFPSTRQRRPRMHSTVAESMYEQWSKPKIAKSLPVTAPAFPVINAMRGNLDDPPTPTTTSTSASTDMALPKERPLVSKPPPVPPRPSKARKSGDVKEAPVSVDKKDSGVNTDLSGTAISVMSLPNCFKSDVEKTKGFGIKSRSCNYCNCKVDRQRPHTEAGEVCHNKDLVCSLCKSKIQCCCRCKECQVFSEKIVACMNGHEREGCNRGDDLFIDDNFEDMEMISMTSDEILMDKIDAFQT